MNARAVHAAAGVIHAAMQTHQTAAGIAMAVEAAGLLMSPETAAAHAAALARVTELERQLTTLRAKALDEGADELTTYNDQFDPNCHCKDIYGCPSCIARDHADTLRGMAREGGEPR